MGIYVVRNLKEIRKEKYPKAKDFAKRCKLSEKTIYRAEGGKVKVSPHTIGVMATILGVEEDELIDETVVR